MTVLAFPALPQRPRRQPPLLVGSGRVSGSFPSPWGRRGSFTGSYRLERFVCESGQLAAAGVFTGELVAGDGTRIGLASRRHAAAVRSSGSAAGVTAQLGPLDVSLLGFSVTVHEFTVDVHRSLAPDTECPSGSAQTNMGSATTC